MSEFDAELGRTFSEDRDGDLDLLDVMRFYANPIVPRVDAVKLKDHGDLQGFIRRLQRLDERSSSMSGEIGRFAQIPVRLDSTVPPGVVRLELEGEVVNEFCFDPARTFDQVRATPVSEGSTLKFMPPGHFCPDVVGIEDFGEADFLRGRVVRAFFRVMSLWPHPKAKGLR